MKQELSKAKKVLREREKEISKLKVDAKKTDNNSFAIVPSNNSNGVSPQQQPMKGATEANLVPSEKKDDQNQIQLKTLQKKVRDLTNEGRSKKSKIEEQELSLKTLQEKIQAGKDELLAEQKRAKLLEDDLAKSKKSAILENNARTKCIRELELIALIGRRDKIAHSDMCKKVKDEGLDHVLVQKSVIEGVLPQSLKDLFVQGSLDVIQRVVPYYIVLSESINAILLKDALSVLKRVPLKERIEEYTNKDSLIQFDKFMDVIKTMPQAAKALTSDHLEAIKMKYIDIKLPMRALTKSISSIVSIQANRLMEDVENADSMENQKKSTSVLKRPSVQKKVEAEDNYEEDFEEGKVVKKADSDVSPDSSAKKPRTKSTVALGDNNSEATTQNKEQEEAADPAPGKERDGKYMDEEEMLDVAEHCFIRMAESLIEKGRTARMIFTKYSIPEQFPDGTVLELLSPIGFLEGVKEAAGIEDLTEMEAACLLRVLAKPELDNAIILNEFTMIMENFGVPDIYDDLAEGAGAGEEEDDDDFDDYVKEEDYEDDVGEEEKKEGDVKRAPRTKPKRRKIVLNFQDLEAKGLKILRKLARFLLERYMHPREFYGPAIYR